MKFRIVQFCLFGIFVAAFLVFSAEHWMNLDYMNRMPRVPSGEQTIELNIGHGHRVFVDQQEYDKYEKCDTRSTLAGWFAGAAVLALYLLMRKRKNDASIL
jgi:hypothetical protein